MAQNIGARILNGEFAPGTLLPNEAELCRSFGVSRTAVRRGDHKMLMGKGLITSRGLRLQDLAHLLACGQGNANCLAAAQYQASTSRSSKFH